MMQLENLVGVPWPAVDSWKEPGLVDQLPDQGSLPPDAAHQLARILGRHTATASSCWFAIWEGFGDLGALRDLVAARLPVPQRGMVVLRGRLEDADQLVTDCGRFQSANLWWPDDRSWCVATEIDLRSTYVGGSPSAIQAVIDDPSLEAFAADASDRIDVWSDTRNPAPADG
ncbi:MAG TPA: hypothetical protein VGU73_00540 [Acidimicrobiia bacterium]|nr:hypothetical protein [Acidimicrobiia bacterium]